MREFVLTRDQILRAIHHLQNHTSAGVARNSELASRLGVKGPSVTARIQELAQAGLVRYLPRQGASLTEAGDRLAIVAITRLRLIERFLSEVLQLPSECIAEEAEHIARYISDRVMDGIAGYYRIATGVAESD